MNKSSWQSRRRHGRRSHQQNPWFRLRDPEDRSDSQAAQSAQDSSHGDDESPSTSSGTAGASSVPELPGFYFDPEKKRYFRLLPGHNNCNPLTKESIRQKEMESKRLRLLEEEDKQKKADTNSDRLFTVNDVKVGGSKYGIINLQSLKTPTLKVFMHENLYFTNRKVPLLFNGCRSGEIFAIDLRCGNQGKGWKATCLLHDSAVTSVRILQDEQYLMASDMAGKIKLWDLRTTKCIRQYEGHVNEYAYLPLHVHEEEGILVAVGQDCYTRIWSLHDAHLLRTIPSPYPASKADIPSVAFSSRLGGSRGAPGLLMAVGQDLYCYSYS
uniref:DDB1 and CUL4 associated factor 4 n=1 Tax=Mandrillus leucophaeus TaxID=9568 RepID=A0A2K5ZVP1_MANLE